MGYVVNGSSGAASTPTGTGYRHVTAGVEDAAASTAAEVAADLGAARRGAAAATTRLLWECQEASGDVLNTGSLGAAGDLATIGGGVTYRSLAPYSTLGPGLALDGTSSGYARGAAGQVVGDGTTVTLWAVVVPHSLAAKRYVVARDWGAPGAWAEPWLCCALAVGPSGLTVGVNTGGSAGDWHELNAGSLTVNRQHLLGLTFDGSTLRAWINGELAGSASHAGAIDWGDPTALWHLGENDNGEQLSCTLLRAGAEASVWSATRWAEEYARINGHPVTP